MKLTRRQWILGGSLGVATVPLSYIFKVSLGGYPKYTGKPLKHLTDKEIHIIRKLGETMIPPDSEFGLDFESVGGLAGVDEFFNGVSTIERSELHILLWAIEHVVPAYDGNWSKFTRMSPEDRQTLFKKMNESSSMYPRLFVRTVKFIINFSFFSQQPVLEKLGVYGWCGK